MTIHRFIRGGLDGRIKPSRGIALIDEVSMLGTPVLWPVFGWFTVAVDVVLVGGSVQLPPICAGNPFPKLVSPGRCRRRRSFGSTIEATAPTSCWWRAPSEVVSCRNCPASGWRGQGARACSCSARTRSVSQAPRLALSLHWPVLMRRGPAKRLCAHCTAPVSRSRAPPSRAPPVCARSRIPSRRGGCPHCTGTTPGA